MPMASTSPLTLCGQKALTLMSRPSLARFATSSRLQAIGPESPSWLPVPQAAQPAELGKPPVKGILPIPRPVIGVKSQVYKATQKHLDQTAPAPSRDRHINLRAPDAQQQVFRAGLAATRRGLLRQGISDLFARRVETARTVREQRTAKRTSRREQLQRPLPQHELYTRDTVPQVVLDALAWRATKKTLAPEEKQVARANYDGVVEARVQQQMDNVHQLYLHARDFIVTEEQLDAEIERRFGTDDDPVVWKHNNHFGLSIWRHGAPLGTEDMLTSQMGAWTQDMSEENKAVRRRMMRIVGKLTGGDVEAPGSDSSSN